MEEIGQIINGLKIIGEPERSGKRGTIYRYPCECMFCGKIKLLGIHDIRTRKTMGCGCLIDGKITKNGISFYDWCIKNHQEYFLNLWDSDKNLVQPTQVSSVSQNHYYFTCPNNRHESTSFKIANLTRRIRTRCLCPKCNSFAQHLIDTYGDDALDQYWDYDKNIINPWAISYGSKETIYIKCQKKTYHNSYDTTAKDFFRGRECPCCSHKRIHPLDSFAAYCNQKFGDGYIDKIWDYENNSVNPWQIAPQSNIYVYIKCLKNKSHQSHLTLLPNVFKTKYHCPRCAMEAKNSVLQNLVVSYIQNKYNYLILHEYDCSIKLRNPQTNSWLRYDNEVIIPNRKRLIVEVHGMQHYVADCGYNNKRAKQLNTTSEEVMKNQQYRDNLKQKHALDNGYEYLIIPYWTENNKSYRTLLDNKFYEILSNTI